MLLHWKDACKHFGDETAFEGQRGYSFSLLPMIRHKLNLDYRVCEVPNKDISRLLFSVPACIPHTQHCFFSTAVHLLTKTPSYLSYWLLWWNYTACVINHSLFIYHIFVTFAFQLNTSCIAWIDSRSKHGRNKQQQLPLPFPTGIIPHL